MKLRIPEYLWQPLCEQLFTRKDVESAGLLFGESVQTPTGTIIAIRDALTLTDEAYLIRRRDQLSLDPVAFNRLIRRARDQNWSVFTIHTHPDAIEPWFSAADDAGDARLMPSIRCQIPHASHGSIVLTHNGHAVARLFDENAASTEIPVHIVGHTLRRTTHPPIFAGEPWFSRQELALGTRGQNQLRNLRVGVIGLGGIGSIVSLQLAHLGIGELVLLDGDIVEASNISRIAGATKEDVDQTYKVEVATRYAKSLGLVRNVKPYPEFLETAHTPLLASCDAIVCCVDRHTPRALLNRIAYAYHIPVIDLGNAFRVNSIGTIIGDAGRVVIVGPGRPCLGCWGHLDPQALRIEALPPEDRENEIQAGYIEGANEAQPSVVAFNTLVAGAGIVELLRIVTSFAGAESPPLRLAFSFSEGTIRRNTLIADRRCEICSPKIN